MTIAMRGFMVKYRGCPSHNSTKMIPTNHPILRRAKHRKSLAYIPNETFSKPVTHLKHKKFSEAYRD